MNQITYLLNDQQKSENGFFGLFLRNGLCSTFYSGRCVCILGLLTAIVILIQE